MSGVVLQLGDEEQVTAADVLAVSRYRASGLQAVLQLGDWELTRRSLLDRRLSADAWVTAGGERIQLTDEAAQMIAAAMNGYRPWEGGAPTRNT